MHLQQVNKGILPLIFIVGLFKITGLEAVENQKGKQDVVDYEYSDESEASTGVVTPPTTLSDLEKDVKVVYATHEGENVTLKCTPKKLNDTKQQEILWYRDGLPITTGNTTLVVGDFELDNKFGLTIFNYTLKTPGNFSCRVLPADFRQWMSIEFSAPDNISEPNSAAIINSYQIAVMMTLVAVVMTAVVWN